MRYLRVLVIAACLFGPHAAHGELASLKIVPPTYAVRQGTRQLAVHAERATCEADAQARTTNPIAARLSFQLRSGGGTLLDTLTNQADCLAAPVTRLTADGSRRPTPPNTKESNVQSCVITTNYSTSFQPPTCVATHSVIATYTAAPSTPPPPSCSTQPSTETRACPPGTSGTWSQTSTVSPYPGCVVTWAPTSPPANRCPPIVQPTGPTLTLSVVNVLEVHLAWSGQASAAYSVEKCRGSGCTNFAPLTCTQASRFIDLLPATATARYRVRGNSEINCSGSFGPYGAAQQVTVGGTVNAGEALISWTPPTTNTDGSAITNLAGYYVLYGPSPQDLNRQIIVSNAGVSRYTVTNLSAGTWYFAMKSYTTNFANMSDLSNIVSKSVR